MSVIEHIESPLLDELCTRLRELASELDRPGDDGLFPWPERQLALCGEYGVFRWFIEKDHGGLGWSDEDLVRGYLALSASCLTTTFIITQRTGACRRIINSESDFVIGNLLPDLISGSAFSTLGISHLTTSHRHLAKPVLTAEASDAGFVLNGFSPWVTGGDQADTIVVGATMSDGRQVLTICPTSIQGVIAERPADLVALSSSHTGRV
ncbi:MAG TPA: acyl-CoA dehydrogenase, partial [Planctomycetaceae bacterium]|nr:acyl-CoA dehydrogenase [Planctomycetaceae bacterium]